MAYIAGLMLLDAPASALNNGQAEDITGKVKSIRTRAGSYPYVSAQSYRYWLRMTLDNMDNGWKASPVYTAGKGKSQQSYTAAQPIDYDDDDLLGYMRATKEGTVTRVSPLRTSTLVSIAPSPIIDDFGVMARIPKEEGDKEGVVLHGHEFYRAILQGAFSLDLQSAGTFTNQMRSGFQNLSKEDADRAKEMGLEYIDALKAYRLPLEQRVTRVQRLLMAMSRVQGGAKLALHYTDVAPVFVIAMVIQGGNNPFGHIITTDNKGEPQLHAEALNQALRVFDSERLSGVYVGRVAGFMDEAEFVLNNFQLQSVHPREALDALAEDLTRNPDWMD